MSDTVDNAGEPTDVTDTTDLKTLEDLKSALTKVRQEAAQRRIEARELQEKNTELTEQVAALSDEKAQAAERVTAAEKELLKFRVAATSGVPLENIDKFAARLQGDDEESLKKDATELLAAFGGSKKSSFVDPSQGHGDGEGAGLSPGAAFLASRLSKGIK